MKYLFSIILFVAVFCSCAESLEDRAEREAMEFTEKNCPAPVSRELAIDSMTFSKQKLTFTYYYSISPKYDASTLDVVRTEDMLLRELKNQTNLIRYKQAGYSFRYIYYELKNPSHHLIDLTLTSQDYGL